MTLFEVGTGTLTGEGEPAQAVGLRVTTNFLSMLGARTVLGRGFTAAAGARRLGMCRSTPSRSAFGVSLDYTLTDDGKLVCGSRTRERPYTEYWTLIRGAARTGADRTDAGVPELRRAARHQHGRHVQALQSQGHDRRVRLGAQPHRAGRGLRGLSSTPACS